jgi:hypothetical protein
MKVTEPRPESTDPASNWSRLLVLAAIFGSALPMLKSVYKKKAHASSEKQPLCTTAPDAAVLAQFHAAEYAAERNSVDVWKTLQYALVPIMFGSWYLLTQVRGLMPFVVFSWTCGAVLPLCFVAYQKAMVDAMTGILLIEERVRPRAIKLAGADDFWFHEPIYRRDVPTDAAYAWFWPPVLSFSSPLVVLTYLTIRYGPISWKDVLGYLLCCLIAWGVGALSKQGLLLNKQIDEAIKTHQLSWLRKESLEN